MDAKVKNYIAGKWLDALDGRCFESRNPADNRELVASVAYSGREDVDMAVGAARDAFRAWKLMPAPKRGELLFRAAEILARRKAELGRLVALEMGKVLPEALGDVQEAIDMAYYMAGEGRRLYGETVPSELPDKDCKSIREPHGAVALVTPWNFPTAIPAWKLFPALICGNTAVLKPSSFTPACAAALVETLGEAGVPPGVVNLVNGPGEEIGEYLVTHPGIDAVSFTGSCAAGERLESLLGKLHRPLAAEMGGKNAIIIMDDADLSLALEGVLWGGFGTSGQRCTAASRVFIHENVYARFRDMLRDAAARLRLGPGISADTDVGPVVNEQQLNRVLEYLRIGEQEGAVPVTGGRRATEGALAHGYFIEPTVFADVEPRMRIA
ncbi:MAG: aldehyde dehydrogenase family protein, partial [Deltaproteobacteria bacterium]|nr:aldehyde dehydrogenase family protein [Deltaproteobacteria bacterium]